MTDAERMVWAAAFVASHMRDGYRKPLQALQDAARAVTECHRALYGAGDGEPARMLREMFADPESTEDRTQKVRPEDDRALRALQEFWEVAGSLLASENSLAKAALAMVPILEGRS